MTVEINIDQKVLTNELNIKRQFKSELENELESLKAEASNFKKRQDVLTSAREGMNLGIDLDIINDEIKTINDQVWKLLQTIQDREKAIGYYDRLIRRLEEMQD